MGKDLYAISPKAREIYDRADEALGEKFSEFVFNATEDQLMDTRITQPAIFIYEVALAMGQNAVKADCVAGHSLGEYSALVACGALDFEECLMFVKHRGQVFYDAFQKHPSAMGAIIGISEEQVLDVLKQVGDEDGEHLYIANYNGPGQLVITGARASVKKACKVLKGMGAKRALVLPQKGVGHSPFSAEEGAILEVGIRKLNWHTPHIPIYQDADGLPHTNVNEIIENQVKLMTYPVQWTTITMKMAENGVTEYYECGTDDTLQKIVKRMQPNLLVTSLIHTPEYEGKIKDFSIVKEQ